MDQKPFTQQPSSAVTPRFVIPSVQSPSVVSVPGIQASQQPRVLTPASIQSPSSQPASGTGYPTTTTPNQLPTIKVEPGQVVDSSGLTGTIISIKEEMTTSAVSDVDRKPPLDVSSAGPELVGDVANMSSSELDDGSGTVGLLDPKSDPSCPVIAAPTKAPVAKKGELWSPQYVQHCHRF